MTPMYVAALDCGWETLDALFKVLPSDTSAEFRGFHSDVSDVILNKVRYGRLEFAAVQLSHFQPSGLTIDLVIFDRPAIVRTALHWWDARVVIVCPPASLHENLADLTSYAQVSSNTQTPSNLRLFFEAYNRLIPEAKLLCTTKSANKSPLHSL